MTILPFQSMEIRTKNGSIDGILRSNFFILPPLSIISGSKTTKGLIPPIIVWSQIAYARWMGRDDTFKAGYCLTHYPLFIFTDAMQGNIYIIDSIKSNNNGSMASTYVRNTEVKTRQNPLSVCLHRISNGSHRGKKEQAIVFCFSSQLHKQSY